MPWVKLVTMKDGGEIQATDKVRCLTTIVSES